MVGLRSQDAAKKEKAKERVREREIERREGEKERGKEKGQHKEGKEVKQTSEPEKKTNSTECIDA